MDHSADFCRNQRGQLSESKLRCCIKTNLDSAIELNRESCIALVRNQVLYRVFATIYYICRLCCRFVHFVIIITVIIIISYQLSIAKVHSTSISLASGLLEIGSPILCVIVLAVLHFFCIFYPAYCELSGVCVEIPFPAFPSECCSLTHSITF